jgi:hypothetical protein
MSSTDTRLALGSIRGYRWWRVGPGPYLSSPWRGSERWDPVASSARCLPRRRLLGTTFPHPDGVPEPSCACGFYGIHDVPDRFEGRRWFATASWRFDAEISGGAHGLVFGVVEGFGRVVVGEIGWRAGNARVNALYASGAREPSPLLVATARRYGVPLYRDLSAMVREWAPDPVSSVPAA